MDNEVFTLSGPSEIEPELRLDPQRDWIWNMQAELDAYYAVMQQLNLMDPPEVMQKLSSFSARASEMRSQLVRVDARRSNTFRTREVDPFLEECDRQFKIHSRLQSFREFDWKMSTGQGF